MVSLVFLILCDLLKAGLAVLFTIKYSILFAIVPKTEFCISLTVAVERKDREACHLVLLLSESGQRRVPLVTLFLNIRY